MNELQYMSALERANECREARAALKKEIREDPEKLSEVLREPTPHWLKNMKIGELLRARKWMGEAKAKTLLSTIPVSTDRKLGNLTPRERAAIIFALQNKTYLIAA